MRMSADTPGYKGVVPTRQELMPGTNKSRQLPVIGIRPRPFPCQMIPLQTLPTTEKQTNKLKTQVNKQGWATPSHRDQTQTYPLQNGIRPRPFLPKQIVHNKQTTNKQSL